jgi:hypothetical protein
VNTENGDRTGSRTPDSGGESQERWRAMTPGELDEMGAPEWAIDGVVPTECVGVVWGKSGALKTFLGLGMEAAIATGTDWYGHAVKQGAVLYVAAEGFRGIRQRQQAWEIVHGIKLPDTLRVVGGRVNLQDKTDVATFIAWVKDTLPDVSMVVFDTLSKCMPTLKDENGNADMAQVVAGAEEIMRELHTAVIFIAHSDKTGRTLRGGSALEFGTSPRIKLTYDGARVKVMCENQKDADEFEDFILTPQQVDLGAEYPKGSLVLVGASEKADTQAKGAGKETSASRPAPTKRRTRPRVTNETILALIQQEPRLTTREIAVRLKMKESTVRQRFTRMRKSGQLPTESQRQAA